MSGLREALSESIVYGWDEDSAAYTIRFLHPDGEHVRLFTHINHKRNLDAFKDKLLDCIMCGAGFVPLRDVESTFLVSSKSKHTPTCICGNVPEGERCPGNVCTGGNCQGRGRWHDKPGADTKCLRCLPDWKGHAR